jgi:Na+/proline symporter
VGRSENSQNAAKERLVSAAAAAAAAAGSSMSTAARTCMAAAPLSAADLYQDLKRSKFRCLQTACMCRFMFVSHA